MSSKNGNAHAEQLQLRVMQANMSQALQRYNRRGGDVASCEMPFDSLLESESDGIEGGESGPDEYDYAQRRAAIRALFRYLKAEGPHPLKIMKRLWAVGRGMHDEYFASLTMTEAGLMFGESKAAHSWRMRVLSGMIELKGMHGIRLPGQKTPASRAVYSAAQQGNSNRTGGKRKRRRAKTSHKPNGNHACKS